MFAKKKLNKNYKLKIIPTKRHSTNFSFCIYKHDEFLVIIINECAFNRKKRRVSDGINISYDSVYINLNNYDFNVLFNARFVTFSDYEILLDQMVVVNRNNCPVFG